MGRVKGVAIQKPLYRSSQKFAIGDMIANLNTFNGLLMIASSDKLLALGCSPLTIQPLDIAKWMVRTNNGYAGVSWLGTTRPGRLAVGVEDVPYQSSGAPRVVSKTLG